MTTVLDDATTAAAPAAAAVTAPAAAPAAQSAAAPAAATFNADEARKFLTDHGVKVEGLDDAALQERHGLAKGIAEKAAAAGAKPKAPEKYEPVKGVELDKEVGGEFEAFAKANGLSQAEYQKGIQMGAKIAERQTKAFETAIAAAQTKWAEQSRADTEFGGAKLEENLAVARKARDSFTTPEFRKMLDDSKLGNHPEMIRLFYRIGGAMKEDKVVSDGRAAAATGDIANRLYGKTTPAAQ